MNKAETILYLRDIYREYLEIENERRETEGIIGELAQRYNGSLHLPVIDPERFFSGFESEKQRLTAEFLAYIGCYRKCRQEFLEMEKQIRRDESRRIGRQRAAYEKLLCLLGEPQLLPAGRIGSAGLFESIPDLVRIINDTDEHDLQKTMRSYLAGKM